MRRSESHRRGLAYETRLRTRTLPAQDLVGTLGLAPSWSLDDCFTGSLGQLYRQRSPGVIDGTRTRFSVGHIHVPRLLRHRSQSAWSESNTHRSLIGRLHDRRATGGKGSRALPRGFEPLRLSPLPDNHRAAARREANEVDARRVRSAQREQMHADSWIRTSDLSSSSR